MKATEAGVEVEPASAAARVALAALAALFLLAAYASDDFFDRVGEWIAEDPELALERVEQFIGWVAVASLPLLIAGVITFRTGLRAVSSGRFPPRGMWLIVATPVVTGPKAKWRGRMMLVGALLMVAIAIGLPAGLWYIIHAVAAGT